MCLLNAYNMAICIYHPTMNQVVSAIQIRAAMSCHAAINSLSETMFKVSKKCILDEMATCLTFMRNNLSCFIIELSQKMRISKSSRTFHRVSAISRCQDCTVFCFSERKKNKKKHNNKWIISWGISYFFPVNAGSRQHFPLQSQWLHWDWTASTFSDHYNVLYWMIHMQLH